MASVMSWEDKIINNSFKDIINKAIQHLDKNGGLAVSVEEAQRLFALPAKKPVVSVIRRDDLSPQEQGMMVIAKLLKRKVRTTKAISRQAFRGWAKEVSKQKKKDEREAKKADKLAAAQAEKDAKKEEKAAKKAEKLAAAQAEKDAKKEEREAKKAEKLAEAQAEKDAKKAEREAEKLAKKEEREANKAEKQAAAKADKDAEKLRKKEERNLAKAEKERKKKEEKEAEKARLALIPCPKCYEGSGKMTGHRGRCKTSPPSSPAVTFQICPKVGESTSLGPVSGFVECDKCEPGSGKPKGHRGKHKGSKKVKPEEESKDIEVSTILSTLASMEESVAQLDEELPETSPEPKEDGEEVSKTAEEDAPQEEDTADLDDSMKVTIKGVDYYKTNTHGLTDVIFTYPDGDAIGVLSGDGETIEPFPESDDEDAGED
tara:strand:+ start:1115 stop:2407 length:1293 start_codon:yes stop_codon:yes gene_type:complete